MLGAGISLRGWNSNAMSWKAQAERIILPTFVVIHSHRKVRLSFAFGEIVRDDTQEKKCSCRLIRFGYPFQLFLTYLAVVKDADNSYAPGNVTQCCGKQPV